MVIPVLHWIIGIAVAYQLAMGIQLLYWLVTVPPVAYKLVLVILVLYWPVLKVLLLCGPVTVILVAYWPLCGVPVSSYYCVLTCEDTVLYGHTDHQWSYWYYTQPIASQVVTVIPVAFILVAYWLVTVIPVAYRPVSVIFVAYRPVTIIPVAYWVVSRTKQVWYSEHGR